MILLSLLLQAAEPGAQTPAQRAQHCRASLEQDAVAAEREATAWIMTKGGAPAHACLALALAHQARWTAAAPEFELAAQATDGAEAATYRAQAGNAWLAAAQPAKAKAALDAALGSGAILDRTAHGEALIDRARAEVADNAPLSARSDLDLAIAQVPEDPMVWLLSASLARRMKDLPRAKTDIAAALQRAGDDAAVQLEAGNIAAQDGDEAGAKAGWTAAARIAPEAPEGRSARQALDQFSGQPKAEAGR